MKQNDTMLRLKRFRIDEIQRRIASIDAMRAEIERNLTEMDENVAHEKKRAGNSSVGRLAFLSFLRSIEMRRENLRTTLKEIEPEYAAAQVHLSIAIDDLQSLEVAIEQKAGVQARQKSLGVGAKVRSG